MAVPEEGVALSCAEGKGSWFVAMSNERQVTYITPSSNKTAI